MAKPCEGTVKPAAHSHFVYSKLKFGMCSRIMVIEVQVEHLGESRSGPGGLWIEEDGLVFEAESIQLH